MKKLFLISIVLSALLSSCLKSISEPSKKQHLTNGLWTVESWEYDNMELADLFPGSLNMNFNNNGLYTLYIDNSISNGVWSLNTNETILEITVDGQPVLYQVVLLENFNARFSSIGNSVSELIILTRP